MSISREQLINNYVYQIRNGDAAMFIGAGMSRSSGFVDWRGLLSVCAAELNLDINQEQDLVAVAQYYLNRRGRDRSRLNQILKDEFDKEVTASENHQLIGKLPVSTIWTTNFDNLIEDSLKKAGRKVDVKSRDQDIAITTRGRDVVVYKMHGDIARPDQVIICKDDYERYALDHKIFQNTLESDLVNKTFLFLGFSFSDPNLDYMLGHLRSLLEDSKREHYAIMRRARDNWEIEDKEKRQKLYEYEKNKQKLQIEDLQRYSIQTHLIEKYSDVTDILKMLEKCYYQRNVFVSGSANKFGDLGEERVRDLCIHFGEMLIAKDYKLVCGLGLNIGDSVFKGALVKLYEQQKNEMENYLHLRPFPRNLPEDVNQEDFNYKYRREMIDNAGVAVFIAGTSRSAEISIGVMEEFEIAKSLGKTIIPLGVTGFAARRIWEEMAGNLGAYYSGYVSDEKFNQLNDPDLSNEQILKAVFEIIELESSV